MTSQSAAWLNDGDEVNPKIDPALNSNTEKEPDDWVSGGDPELCGKLGDGVRKAA
jgi:hypothetical protein